MKILITSKKPVLTVERGRLPTNIPIDVSDHLAKFLIERGEALMVETKEQTPDVIVKKRGRPRILNG